jgi:ABC-type transporter Mla MlaB component
MKQVPVTLASSTTKTDRHDIAEILLKVALNSKNQVKSISCTNNQEQLLFLFRLYGISFF